MPGRGSASRAQRTNGVEAIEAYRPHVVLLDIGMPGMDGYEVAKRFANERSLAISF